MTADEEITAVVRDYFEGWFDADVARMDRALHPDLVKRRAGESLGITTKESMVKQTGEGVGREDGKDRTLEIDVLDVHEDIATVVVRSAVYHEYVHLVHTADGWKVANALWQLR
jgi:ketosteroid isomerase-like protein